MAMKISTSNITQALIDNWKGVEDVHLYDDGSTPLTRTEFLSLCVQRQQKIGNLIPKGEPVVVTAGRGPLFFIDLLVCWACGGIAVPLAGDASAEYKAHVIRIAKPALILDHSNSAKDTISFSSQLTDTKDTSLQIVETTPNDLGALLFTSGSTGVPKGVMLSHHHIISNAWGVLKLLPMHNDRLFINIPYNYTSAICHFLACALSTSTLIGIEEKLFLADLPIAISKMNATAFGGAPVQLRWIIEAIQHWKKNEKSNKLNLKFVMSSGDNLPIQVIEMFLEYAPKTSVITVYGLTELGGRFCFLSGNDVKRYPGSVGKPIPGLEVTVLSPDSDKELASGCEGEIVARGDLLFNGYLNNEEATQKALTPAGLRTGDIGYLNSKGYLFLKGRVDDVFKVNGQKVSATVIADALMRVDCFRDVAVTASTHPLQGTVPVAFYVMRNNTSFEKGKVLKVLRTLLPTYNIPDQFIPLNEIPRTASGKIKRHELKALLSRGE